MYYLDTSALVKLVVDEPETAALRSWIATADADLVSSDLARTELVRAVRRVVPDRLVAARAVLDGLVLLTLPATRFDQAARMDPVELRSLDAIHLSVALELGDALTAMVCYDDRLASAARSYGVEVVAPSSMSSWCSRPGS